MNKFNFKLQVLFKFSRLGDWSFSRLVATVNCKPS